MSSSNTPHKASSPGVPAGSQRQNSPLPGPDEQPLSSFPVVRVAELGWTPRTPSGPRRPVQTQVPPHPSQNQPPYFQKPKKHMPHGPPYPQPPPQSHKSTQAPGLVHSHPPQHIQSRNQGPAHQYPNHHNQDHEKKSSKHYIFPKQHPQAKAHQPSISDPAHGPPTWSPPPPMRSHSSAVAAQGPRSAPATNISVSKHPITQGPAWLTSGYVHKGPSVGQSAGTGSSVVGSGPLVLSAPNETIPSSSPETWWHQRVDAIVATVAGGDAIPEFRKALDRLEDARFSMHRENLKKIRSEKWAARKRSRKATTDLLKYQRDMIKIDAQAEHINAKISRLQSYIRFIERGWHDDSTENDKPGGVLAKAEESATCDAEKEPQKSIVLPSDSKVAKISE